ncbi:MAG: hypothetical protein IKP50_01580 [Bacilli bacterium]|nr:hypothetical protein [Bacilli bacterium]
MEEQKVKEKKVKEKKIRKKKAMIFYLLLSLGLVFGGAIVGQAINENGYHTKLSSFRIPTDDGQWITGTTFKPDTATSANPAPAVVFVPGFQRSKESHYDIALEIARRGMVCFIIDPYNQGDSSATMNTSASSSEAGAYGAIPMINYLYDTDNINYIDKNSIHIVGHSAGGNSTMTAGVYFSNLAGGVFENCKVKSIYISGYIRNIIDVEYAYDGNGDYLKDENGHYVFEEIDWEGSIAGYNDGLIKNCYTGRRLRSPSNTTITERRFLSPVIGSYNVGGIAGEIGENSVITNVFSTANVWAYGESGYTIAKKADNAIGVLHNMHPRTSSNYLGMKYGAVKSNDLVAPEGEHIIMVDNSALEGLAISWGLGFRLNKNGVLVADYNAVKTYLELLGDGFGFRDSASHGIRLVWEKSVKAYADIEFPEE